MQEKNFQTNFSRWLKYNKVEGKFELKFTKGLSIPFSAVKDHQEQGVAVSPFVLKLPDDSIGQKPCDCICMIDRQGYIVIQFYKRGCKRFYMIRIEDWLFMKEHLVKKSVTEKYAKMYGKVCELS